MLGEMGSARIVGAPRHGVTHTSAHSGNACQGSKDWANTWKFCGETGEMLI